VFIDRYDGSLHVWLIAGVVHIAMDIISFWLLCLLLYCVFAIVYSTTILLTMQPLGWIVSEWVEFNAPLDTI